MKKGSYILLITLILACSKRENKGDDVVCFETKESIHEPDKVKYKTCQFREYLMESIGTPDNVGRYSYEYNLMKVVKNDTIKIKNSELFSNKTKQLEDLINKELKKEHERLLTIPDIQDCMSQIDFREYKLDEFGISFNYQGQLEFNIDYEIMSACTNVGGSQVVFNISEIKHHLTTKN